MKPVFRSDMTVEAIRVAADDNDVVRAARVSTIGEASRETVDINEHTGLINYLAKNRHGCYDSQTDVLTNEGWKNWTDITGIETFATINPETLETEYQQAEQHIRLPVINEPMIRVESRDIDLLVTADHNMLTTPLTTMEPALVAASTLTEGSTRMLYVKNPQECSMDEIDDNTHLTRIDPQCVTTDIYTGEIHCVTVPNGTLLVRRNGKIMWSGNSPFEHNQFTFFIEAPIFVFREFHRHRIGWSYNEASGRYRQLEPVFYVPDENRNLVQEGKTGHYTFVPGSELQQALTRDAIENACTTAYDEYERMLEAGIAREVARATLPVTTYSSMYATCNARSLMAFLSLRTKSDDSVFPSYPQREIEMVAEAMETVFAQHMPITYAAFIKAGRVAP